MQVIWECMYRNDRHHAPMPRGCHLVAVEKPTGHTALARIFLCKYNKQCTPEIGSLTSVTSMYITRRQLFVVDQAPKVCEILKDSAPSCFQHCGVSLVGLLYSSNSENHSVASNADWTEDSF